MGREPSQGKRVPVLLGWRWVAVLLPLAAGRIPTGTHPSTERRKSQPESRRGRAACARRSRARSTETMATAPTEKQLRQAEYELELLDSQIAAERRVDVARTREVLRDLGFDVSGYDLPP
jgi:hypothetical protein